MLREDRKSKPNGHFLDSNKPPKLKKCNQPKKTDKDEDIETV